MRLKSVGRAAGQCACVIINSCDALVTLPSKSLHKDLVDCMNSLSVESFGQSRQKLLILRKYIPDMLCETDLVRGPAFCLLQKIKYFYQNTFWYLVQ